jgi:Holliday junction resolvase RusA-like endonuclease
MRLSFRVDGAPVAKARPRMTKSGHVWTPAKTKAHEDLIALQARSAKARSATRHEFGGAVMVTVHYHMPMPRSWSKKRKEAQRFAHHIQKPDLDNLVKTVLDALNKAAIWQDDAQVASVTASKIWADTGSTEIEIATLSDYPSHH